MNDNELGASVRTLRHRRGWRQQDLAARAGASRVQVTTLECGGAEKLGLRAIRGIASALGIRLAWSTGYRGPELARRRDADHAAIGERSAGLNVKVRLAPVVARSLGLRPAGVVPMILIAEGTTNRRRVAGHAQMLGRFSLRGRAAAAWLRRPPMVGQADIWRYPRR